MNKKQRIILIVVAVIVALIIIGTLIYFIEFANKTESEETLDATYEYENSKINDLYTQLEQQQTFSFTTTDLEKGSKEFYAKNGEKAYVETVKNNKKTQFIIRDGNSYLLSQNSKKYYTYENNSADLNKIIIQLEEVVDTAYTKGKEKIENKKYEYEEYNTSTDFVLEDLEDDDDKTTKTRFYFDGDKLVYIKTIIGNKEETLKVDISNSVDDNLFEIPSDYVEG